MKKWTCSLVLNYLCLTLESWVWYLPPSYSSFWLRQALGNSGYGISYWIPNTQIWPQTKPNHSKPLVNKLVDGKFHPSFNPRIFSTTHTFIHLFLCILNFKKNPGKGTHFHKCLKPSLSVHERDVYVSDIPCIHTVALALFNIAFTVKKERDWKLLLDFKKVLISKRFAY